MPHNIRIVSTYPPRRCGIGTFSRDLSNALAHFTGEVGHIRVAAIDNDNGPYDIPVDLVIDQQKKQSWRDITRDIIIRAREAYNPTVILLQHEYGLDYDEHGNAGQGNNFIEMVVAFREQGLTSLVYLHTVLQEPDQYQADTIRQLAKYSDGLIVTTESAINILESDIYGISHSKLKHIDHGVRMQQPSQYDRLEIKKEFGIENRFLATTLGLLSPGKGIEYGIRAYGRFIHESLTDKQRRQTVYLIVGQPHPEFVISDNGRPYREFMDKINASLEESKLKSCRINDLIGTDVSEYDIVFLDRFIDDNTLMKIYGATNVMILPYLNMQQISSGILADTLGAGRVAITTKSMYARELINSNKRCPEGLLIGRYARGILVDNGEPSVEQIAMALDFLVFNPFKRLMMERQAHQRGYQMRWYNSAWALLQYINFINDQKEIVTGRGVMFIREKPSKLEIKKRSNMLI